MRRKKLLLGSYILQSVELMSSSGLNLASLGALDLWSQLEKAGLLSCVLLGMDLPEELAEEEQLVHPSVTAKYTLCLIYAPSSLILEWMSPMMSLKAGDSPASCTAPLHQGQHLPSSSSEEDHQFPRSGCALLWMEANRAGLGSRAKIFRPIFILFSVLKIGKFSDFLCLVNCRPALLNNCGFEDEFCACRWETFPVVFWFDV